MLTGSERIAARPLYGDWFSFQPRLKLFLGCNHKPQVHDDSHGFWRRVHVIPFNQRFAGNQRDQGLTEALKREGSGILNWMLAGFQWWQQDGLMAPNAVVAATEDYEAESNPLSDFIEEQCEAGAEFQETAAALYAAYKSWTRASRPGLPPLTQTMFGRWLIKRFNKQRREGGYIYHGVRLNAGKAVCYLRPTNSGSQDATGPVGM